MRVFQQTWTPDNRWDADDDVTGHGAQLVLLFGARGVLSSAGVVDGLRHRWPGAHVVGCSTGGQVRGAEILDATAVATAIAFDTTTVRVSRASIASPGESAAIGAALARSLAGVGLRHVLVFSDGLHVNGSELTRGLSDALPVGVAATGGLAADDDRFEETTVVLDEHVGPDLVAAVGLYGDDLRIGMGSVGGWDMFGPDRRITRSDGNVLFELDGQPALELYRTYLGPHAANLPASGLLFPLAIHDHAGSTPVVRTILSIDDAAGSLTFAGDMPEGQYARLMHASIDRLIDGAGAAASTSCAPLRGTVAPGLGLLISCVGRRWVLQQRADEEIESVRDVLGATTTLAGFYSYGEISPFTPTARCELHNQTMTVTTLAEHA